MQYVCVCFQSIMLFLWVCYTVLLRCNEFCVLTMVSQTALPTHRDFILLMLLCWLCIIVLTFFKYGNYNALLTPWYPCVHYWLCVTVRWKLDSMHSQTSALKRRQWSVSHSC